MQVLVRWRWRDPVTCRACPGEWRWTPSLSRPPLTPKNLASNRPELSFVQESRGSHPVDVHDPPMLGGRPDTAPEGSSPAKKPVGGSYELDLARKREIAREKA